MRPTSQQLAMRDPALAALMGAHMGSDFGGDFGDFAGDDDDSYGYEFGYEFGAEAAGEVPPPAVAAQLWAKHKQDMMKTKQRVALIEPNKGSSAKIQRYTFNLNAAVTLGTASTFSATNQPDTSIRPQRITCNSPSPGFAQLSEIKVANVSVIVGGTSDAWQFNANGVGQSLDLPTLQPANRASFSGVYSGFTPPGFVGGTSYPLTLTLTGPASIVA